ncbi:MAG: hypothetical protein ACREDE_02060 [Thermoplasmata archaeon]
MVVAVASGLLMVFVVPAGIAAASASELTPGPAYTLWAYGAVRTVDFAGTSGLSFTYKGSATYGYSVVLSQTNLTASTFELSVNRTMGALISVEYCSPNCKNPSVIATVYHHAWESVDAWANFSTNGTVSVNGVNVPAIALLNSHSALTGSVIDSAQANLRNSYLSANVSASADVTFTTPLGLLPLNLTAPMNWSSASAFTASGNYDLDYSYRYEGPHLSSHVGPTSLIGEVARSGNVSVLGSVGGGPSATEVLGGSPYLNVSLDVIGPFTVREGFILIPDEADLFASSSVTPVSANETGGTGVAMTSLYVQPGLEAHLGIGGSEWLYSASAVNPSVATLAPANGGVTEIAGGSNDVASTPVQGVPIPVSQAEGYQGCLVTGGSCPAAAPRGLPPGLGIAILLVVVAGVVGAVIVSERRRIPPPAYPNAKLYPPGEDGAESPREPSRASAERRSPPPSEDDPLANLW